MSRGRPDYAATSPLSGIWGVSDMGELAARLGALSTKDRRGYVVWQDGFEDGLSWWDPQANGAGAAVQVVTTTPYDGALCCELIAGSTGALEAGLIGHLSYSDYGTLGLETAICLSDGWAYLQYILDAYYLGTLLRASLRLVNSDNSLHIDAAGSADVTLATGLDQSFARPNWHSLKLAIDLETGAYRRVAFDNLTYDVSAYSLNNLGTALWTELQVQILLFSNSGQNGKCLVDNVIITRQEP